MHPYINLAKFRETGPLIIERGKGVYVYDSDGKPYIEAMAGLWCTSLGYGNEELVEAAAAQMRKLSFAHLFTGKSHDPAIELAETAEHVGCKSWVDLGRGYATDGAVPVLTDAEYRDVVGQLDTLLRPTARV